jgi:PAS domain S-box-containing protein
MSTVDLTLSDPDFRRLFPFHLMLDENNRILSTGESIQKSIPIVSGDSFHLHFTVYRPFLSHADYRSIDENKETLFILRSVRQPLLQIRGQWIRPGDKDALLFVGSPWFDSLSSIKEHGLTLNDFAIHDPIIDLLHVIKTHEIGMSDLKEVLAKQKHQQRELEKLSLIATETINAIVITNKKGEITWVNKSFERMTGYTLKECAGRKPGGFLQGEGTDSATVKYLAEQIRQGCPFTCEILNYNKQKNPYWVRITGQPVFDAVGELEQFFAIEEDITAQKNAELKLRWSEEKYRGIIENMDLGLVEYDREDRVVYCNQSFCRMTGFTHDLLEGKNLSLLLNQRNANFDASFQLKKKHRGISEVYEVEISDKSGQSKWLLVSKALLYDTQRKIIGSIGIHLDISWRKKMELELKQAQLQALETSKAMENFLVNTSHEIRTPMNVIVGMSRHLSGMIREEKQSRFLDSIIHAADNLLVIINDVLDISKIESGKMEIETIGFSPRKLLSECAQLLQFKAEEKGLRLTYEVADDVPLVLLGDPHRLYQVLMNICGNAIKFTEQGTVDISIYLNHSKDNSVALRFIVEDTGIGIDKYRLKEVFESFRQESTSVSRQYGGTGLGLTISRELVRLMGGDLEIDSQKGIGTRVGFELPFETGTENDLEELTGSTPDPSKLTGKHILVVEDNTMNLALAEAVLESYGATVSTATNGVEALEILAHQSFDVILMDIRMPRMDGLEATRRLRNELRITTPVIALTANPKTEIRVAITEAGLNDFLLKPYRESVLISKIAQLTGSKDSIVQMPVSEPEKKSSKLYNTVKLEAFTVKNKDFLKRMLQLFVEESSSGYTELKAAFTAGDYRRVGDIAHRLKPSFDQLMIDPLFEGIKKIETLAKQGDPEKRLDELVPAMDEILQAVNAQIRQQELQ